MKQIFGTILIAIVVILYLVWFKWTKNQSGVLAKEEAGIQIFDILVKGAYSPAVIQAKVGKPIKINFLRQESSECSRYLVFSDFKIRKELPEGKTTIVQFTPNKKGEFAFTCDMGMYQGRLIVK